MSTPTTFGYGNKNLVVSLGFGGLPPPVGPGRPKGEDRRFIPLDFWGLVADYLEARILAVEVQVYPDAGLSRLVDVAVDVA